MSVKASISSNYLQNLHIQHAHKKFRAPQRVMMTGDQKDGSIGNKIRTSLVNKHLTVRSFAGDVRNDSHYMDHDDELKHTDTLIMCHGVTHLQWFESVSMAKVSEIFDVNLTGSYGLAQYFVQATIDNPWRKRIIMFGSMAHRAVLNGSAAYCASKAGLAMLARCMAWELAPKGYDVFVIHPSNTYGTPMTEETIQGLMSYRGMSRSQAEAYWNDSPIRVSILQPEDIVELIHFLMGPRSSYLSGTQIELAGGQR